MKKFLSIVLTLVLCLTAVSALADETPTIVMGTNAGFEPFEYIDDNGEVAGFDVEIAQYIANYIGAELKIEDIYFDGLLAALEQDMIDFVCAAMTITDERKEAALFADPYYSAQQSVIVMEGNTAITTLEDIAPLKVAVQDGTTGYYMALDTIGCAESNVAAFKASTDCVLELQTGRVDCIIIDNAVAANFLKNYEGLTIVEGLDMPEENYGIAVKMGNEDLLKQINEALAACIADGTYDALIEKYFN